MLAISSISSAVPILRDDDAREVFGKVTVAAEIVLARSLPGLIAGTAPRLPQQIQPGKYFGRRRPEDGHIDWSRPAHARSITWCALLPRLSPAPSGNVGGERWDDPQHAGRAPAPRPPRGARSSASMATAIWPAAMAGAALLAAANVRGRIDLAALALQVAPLPLPLS